MASVSPPYLRAHSYFSLLESLMSPKDLVALAVNQGVKTLGMTDHLYLTGAIEFSQSCFKAGIKPIIGLEINLSYQGYSGLMTLIAENQSGWMNLSRLSSYMLVNETEITMSELEAHRDGLIGISGEPRGILTSLIKSGLSRHNLADQFLEVLRDIFNKNLFIEIQRYPNGPLPHDQTLLALAENHHIPIIATQNIHYAEPTQEPTFRTMMAIKHNFSIHGLPKNLLPPGNAHFPSMNDFSSRYRDLPQSLENLALIEERCQLKLPIGQMHYPKFPTPLGQTQADFLRSKAYSGARKIYKNLTPEIVERLDYELQVITKLGYEPIFLIVEDVINHARDLGIPTSSRGSAASSLVAHCLNITSPDPIALNLYFERFLNPARKKPPDIDTDIASHRRGEVIQYVFDTYGQDRVAMVGTINRYRPKSALGDVAKAYGLPPETIRGLSKRLPSSYRFRTNDNEDTPFSDLENQTSIPFINNMLGDANAILDMPRHLSVHPGGIIIAPFSISNLIPLMHSSTLGINHSQFDLEGVEKLGMVKIDLLGIRSLTVLGEVAEKIQSWHGLDYKNSLAVLASIPGDDPKTATTVEEARTIGCFQIESPGMRATLREIKANSVEDIMAALALYRPGPLRGGLRDAFVRRFKGEEMIEHIHPSLEHLLDDTLGVILYQEQVLRIAHELGGLTIAQADILRRAMSHFDPGKVMDTLKKSFIEGASHRRNVPQEIGERIWEMMAAFAGYGFPKAHAASYAQLAWNSAWCKSHYPAEFMAAVLSFGGGYYSQSVYLMEARRLGLSIQPPHVNQSNIKFRVLYPQGKPMIYMGLNQVKDLTQKTIRNILNNRPFSSLEEFLVTVDPQKKEVENLLSIGAFSDITTITSGLEKIKHQLIPGQMQLFPPKDIADGWHKKDIAEAQSEILGVSLSITPLEQIADQIDSLGAISTLEARNYLGEKVRIVGMRQTWRRIRTHSNQIICFFSIEDLEGSIQVVIPSQLYRKIRDIVVKPGPFLVEGIIKHDSERNKTQLQATKMSLINPPHSSNAFDISL